MIHSWIGTSLAQTRNVLPKPGWVSKICNGLWHHSVPTISINLVGISTSIPFGDSYCNPLMVNFFLSFLSVLKSSFNITLRSYINIMFPLSLRLFSVHCLGINLSAVRTCSISIRICVQYIAIECCTEVGDVSTLKLSIQFRLNQPQISKLTWFFRNSSRGARTQANLILLTQEHICATLVHIQIIKLNKTIWEWYNLGL